MRVTLRRLPSVRPSYIRSIPKAPQLGLARCTACHSGATGQRERVSSAVGERYVSQSLVTDSHRAGTAASTSSKVVSPYWRSAVRASSNSMRNTGWFLSKLAPTHQARSQHLSAESPLSCRRSEQSPCRSSYGRT